MQSLEKNRAFSSLLAKDALHGILLLYAALLVGCTTPAGKMGDRAHRFGSLTEKVHTQIVNDIERPSLATVQHQMEAELQKIYPNTPIKIDAQLSNPVRVHGGIGYVTISVGVAAQEFQLHLATSNVDIGDETLSAVSVASNLICEMRETYRQYLEMKLNLISSATEQKDLKEKITLLMKEEVDALQKHGWQYNDGAITVSEGFVAIECCDLLNNKPHIINLSLERLF